MIRIFRVFVPTSVVALLVSEVILIGFCYLLASLLVIDLDPVFFLLEEGGLLRICLVMGSIMAGLYFHDLYTELRILSRTLLVQQTCLVIGVAFLAQALLSYINRNLMLPRWLMILGSLLTLVLLPAWRMLFSGVVIKALPFDRVLLLGTSQLLVEIARKLEERPELGMRVIGYVTEGQPFPEDSIPGGCLGAMESLRQVVDEHKPNRIVVGMTERRARLPVYELLEMRLAGIRVEEVAATYEAAFSRICIRELRPSQLVFSSEMGPSPGSVSLQTFYSLVITAAALVVSLPVMALVAVAVRLTSSGPILHRQTRVGLNGAPFTVFKFRSMYANAEARTGAVWATRNDPRITPVGRWLRKLRLDEMPQFFNVLRGEMSLVGPRPERPEFVKTLSEKIPFYPQRHCVRPGITGWAQINHKYGDTIEDTITKLEYDLYYIKHLSFSLDFYIMFSTLKTVLLGRGAQ